MNDVFYMNKLKHVQKTIRFVLVAILFFLIIAPLNIQAAMVPDTGNITQIDDVQTGLAALAPMPLETFIEYLVNGNEEQIVGIYIEDEFAQKVIQQPADDAAYVSPFNNQLTDFRMVSQLSGNIGLLAHNYLSGKLFFDLLPGDIVQVVFGDGEVESFQIDRIESYQAVSPHDVQSDFVNLESGKKLSTTQLFETVYGGSYHLTLQTCIRSGDEYSWGRLFVIATPIKNQ